MFTPKLYLRFASAIIPVLLSACSTYRDIPSNSPVDAVYAKMGPPSYQCKTKDGVQRLIWTQQPNGQYAYATNVSSTGHIDKVVSILNEDYFRQLDKGTWTQQDVVCMFGPPAETGRIGWGEKNELIWTYRYKQSNYWNNLMYVYFGRYGEAVTHYHSGPDPRYERDRFFIFGD